MMLTTVLPVLGAALVSSSGCIMGIRKAIGTIQGPRSTIEIPERHTAFPSNAKVGSVALATDGEGSGEVGPFRSSRAHS
jgi:hypothetical protein